MKPDFKLLIAVLCLGGCAGQGELATGIAAGNTPPDGLEDNVLYGLSSVNSPEANPTDRHFCDGLCRYARQVESNRLIDEARRREERLRQEETEEAFDEFFDSDVDPAELADALPPVVIHRDLALDCEGASDPDTVALSPCF